MYWICFELKSIPVILVRMGGALALAPRTITIRMGKKAASSPSFAIGWFASALGFAASGLSSIPDSVQK